MKCKRLPKICDFVLIIISYFLDFSCFLITLFKNDIINNIYDLYVETKAKFPTFKIEVEEAKKRVGKYDHTTMDDIEAYIGDDEHKEWKVEFDKLFGEKIPSKTNATKSVRKVKFAVIRKWFVEKREGEEAEKAKKAREAAAKKAKRTNKKATDEDKAVEQNVPLEVANNSQQEQLDLVS